VAGSARRDGLLPHGVVYGVPRTGTEQWPYLAAGIPSLNVNDFAFSYWREQYHTQYDTPELVSFPDLARETRFYARLVVAADAAPAQLIDGRARVAQLRRDGRLGAVRQLGIDVSRLDAALTRYERAASRETDWASARAAFATVARAVEAIHARDKQSTLHLQALRDVESLDAALAALDRGEAGAAARAASRSGRNALARHVGRDVFRLDAARHTPAHSGYGWAAHARPTRSPELWDELATLRRERGARAPGPWLERSLRRHRERSAGELERRLAKLAAAFERAADQLGG
jgi:hypothetical protein